MKNYDFNKEKPYLFGTSQPRQLGRLLVANLGDSRAVMCRQQGHHLGPFRLSDDHKPGRPDEQRRIEGNGGVVDMQVGWMDGDSQKKWPQEFVESCIPRSFLKCFDGL